MTVQFQTVANTRQMVPGKKVKKKSKPYQKKIYSEPICEVKRPLSFYCLFIAYRSILWLSTGNPWKFSNLDVESNNIQRVFLVCFSPHLCVGFLFLVLHSRALPPLPPPPPPALPPPRTTCPQTTYSYTTSIHTHTQLVNTHTHNLLTPNLSTHNLLKPTLSTYNLITPNLPTHTHNLWTHTHNLSTYKSLHNLLTHNLLTHNLLRPNLLTPNLRTHTHNNLYTHNFAWPALHLATATFTLRGRRGTYVTGLAIVARLGPLVAAAVCIAGVALGDSDLHFAWQAWHLATSTFTLRGRRGTWRYPFSFCVAGMYLSIGTFTLRGRRGIWRQGPSLCVAGMALGYSDLHFAWQAWQLCHWAGF